MNDLHLSSLTLTNSKNFNEEFDKKFYEGLLNIIIKHKNISSMLDKYNDKTVIKVLSEFNDTAKSCFIAARKKSLLLSNESNGEISAKNSSVKWKTSSSEFIEDLIKLIEKLKPGMNEKRRRIYNFYHSMFLLMGISKITVNNNTKETIAEFFKIFDHEESLTPNINKISYKGYTVLKKLQGNNQMTINWSENEYYCVLNNFFDKLYDITHNSLKLIFSCFLRDESKFLDTISTLGKNVLAKCPFLACEFFKYGKNANRNIENVLMNSSISLDTFENIFKKYLSCNLNFAEIHIEKFYYIHGIKSIILDPSRFETCIFTPFLIKKCIDIGYIITNEYIEGVLKPYKKVAIFTNCLVNLHQGKYVEKEVLTSLENISNSFEFEILIEKLSKIDRSIKFNEEVAIALIVKIFSYVDDDKVKDIIKKFITR